MGARKENEPNQTKVERTSDRELVVTRTVNGSARLVFEAWTKPELLKRWWMPKSFGISCISWEADSRTGGKYRLVVAHPSSGQHVAFFGTYIEVTPYARVVWSNEESDDGAITTVTFEEEGGETLVVMRDLYPSKEALDAAIASGSTSGTDETFTQLDELIVTLGASGS